MLQLDQFTYLTQFVWLCVFYTTLYVLLYNDGLPKISRILKLREQLISHQNVGTELSNYSVEQDVLFQECFDTSISYLYLSVSGTSKWCNETVKSLNANQLKKMNKSYVCLLGEISLTNNNKKGTFNHESLYLSSHFSSFTSKHCSQQNICFTRTEEHSSKYPKWTKKEEEYECVNCSYLLL
jgi:hypothetical protein